MHTFEVLAPHLHTNALRVVCSECIHSTLVRCQQAICNYFLAASSYFLGRVLETLFPAVCSYRMTNVCWVRSIQSEARKVTKNVEEKGSKPNSLHVLPTYILIDLKCNCHYYLKLLNKGY